MSQHTPEPCQPSADDQSPQSRACSRQREQQAFTTAAARLRQLADAVGPGEHHVVCSVALPDGPLLASLHLGVGDDGAAYITDTEGYELCVVWAVAILEDSSGGVVARTFLADSETVRGWYLRGAEITALSEAQVFDAYCTDVDTAEPVPPEYGVTYQAGIPIPPLPN